MAIDLEGRRVPPSAQTGLDLRCWPAGGTQTSLHGHSLAEETWGRSQRHGREVQHWVRVAGVRSARWQWGAVAGRPHLGTRVLGGRREARRTSVPSGTQDLSQDNDAK